MNTKMGSDTGGLPPGLASGLEGSQIPSLDGLRTYAVFLVILFHAGVPGAPGGLGVLAFFVLSGFLITWLLLKEEDRSGTIALGKFYMRRTLRLFPAFYVFWFLLVASLILTHKPVIWGQAIASFFYVNNYYQAIFGDPSTGFSHTWSLGVEEQFYLLWPMTFLFFKRNRVAFLCSAIGAVWLYRAVLVLLFDRDQGYLYEAFDARADHLLIGCLLAVLLRRKMASGFWRSVCTPSMIWLTIALLVASTVAAAYSPWRYRDTVGFMADPVLVAVLIVQSIATRQTGFAAMLNWNWMQYLGRISYPLYLYQQIVIGPVDKLAGRWFGRTPSPLTLACEVLAVVLVASLSYRFVELPFLRLKSRFSS